jgi:hypothetical protein
MALENATYIDGLVITNPVSTDGLAQADDHMRLIKSTIKSTFPNITGAISADQTEINVLDGITASTAELNTLTGITATTAELNLLSGLTATSSELNLLSGLTAIDTDLVNDTSPQLSADLDTNGQAIQFGLWSLSIDGSNNLVFAYNGDVKVRLTSAGALDVEDDITAYAGI